MFQRSGKSSLLSALSSACNLSFTFSRGTNTQNFLKMHTNVHQIFICFHVAKHSLVERLRLQQLIKESDQECDKVFNKGHVILYHRGKPFLQKKSGLQSNKPVLSSTLKVQEFLPNIQKEAVFLKLNENNEPLYAAMLPKDIDVAAIEDKLGGKFFDMRAALFLVRSEWSGLMSGGSSLLRWIKSAQFCWSCKAPLKRNASGCQLKCSSCSNVFHPPTSPVGISLIANKVCQITAA